MLKKDLVTWEQAEGWIYNWFICGFFEAGLHPDPSPSLFGTKQSDNWDKELLLPWGGEENITGIPSLCGKADPEWMPVSLGYGPKLSLADIRGRYSDLDASMGDLSPDSWDRIWYALAVIEAEKENSALLKFSGWDGCRLWVNGKLVFQEHSYHHTILDMEEASITLNPGINTLLFKLDRDGCAARIIPEPDSSFKGTIHSITTSESPSDKKISTIDQLRQWAVEKQTEYPFSGSGPDELAEWQKDFREYYHQCLGPFPDIPDGETECVSSETTEQGIERRLYHMPSEAGCLLPFYVMIPAKDKQNGKVITVAHGHRMQWKTVAGAEPPPSPRGGAIGPVYADYAYQLACKGFTTSICCERGFGERNDYKGSEDKCTYAFRLAMAQGFLYPTLHMHDIRRMSEFVMGLPETEGMKGPGLTGLSGGGTLTYLLGAYDDTFKACAVWCGICRYRDYALGAGCGMQIIPLLWPRGDVGELLSLITPRPLLVGQGKYDSTFNVITVRSVAEDAQRAYDAAGCPEHLRTYFPDLAHQVDVDECAKFFDKAL